MTWDELETVGRGPGIVERAPDFCPHGRPISLVGSPVCPCDVAQAEDGHHRVWYCSDVRCVGLRRGPCGLDPDDLRTWHPVPGP